MMHGTRADVWLMIGAIVMLATTGDVLIASAMRQVGDFDVIRERAGMRGAITAVLSNARFAAGVVSMSLSFFSLLFALSWAEVSLVAPASAALTFVTNAIAAKWVLKENVDRRRWMAAACVCAGVFFLAR